MSYRLPGLQSLFAFVGFVVFIGLQPEGIDKFYEPDRVSGLRSEVSGLPSPVSDYSCPL